MKTLEQQNETPPYFGQISFFTAHYGDTKIETFGAIKVYNQTNAIFNTETSSNKWCKL